MWVSRRGWRTCVRKRCSRPEIDTTARTRSLASLGLSDAVHGQALPELRVARLRLVPIQALARAVLARPARREDGHRRARGGHLQVRSSPSSGQRWGRADAKTQVDLSQRRCCEPPPYLCDGLGAARPLAVGQPRSVAGEDIDPSCTGAGAGAGELRYAGAATPTPSVSHSAVGARRTARVAGG
jgi:hypothetical protein